MHIRLKSKHEQEEAHVWEMMIGNKDLKSESDDWI